MIRALKVQTGKPISIFVASEAMTRGCPVTVDFSDETVDKATATGGIYLVDVPNNYDGLNAVIPPNDTQFENIVEGQKVLVIPTKVGERYATTELTLGAIVAGDGLKASGGKFVEAAANDVVEWKYVGTYADPTGTMYAIERVAPYTVA